MPEQSEVQKLVRLCLLTDDAVVEASVRVYCPPPHTLEVFSLEAVVDERNTLSAQGREIVEAAPGYDVLLIDWDLAKAPVINTLCYHVRRRVGVPLVALCRGSQEAQVAALAAGADDVLTFPFYPALLQARATAYHRLVEAAQAVAGDWLVQQPDSAREMIQWGELRLDRAARTCIVGEQEVDLTFREFALLTFFLENAEVACTRDQILDEVWGIQFDTGTNMVDVYVYFLRRKLAAHGFKGVIRTVRGFGYRLGTSEQEAG